MQIEPVHGSRSSARRGRRPFFARPFQAIVMNENENRFTQATAESNGDASLLTAPLPGATTAGAAAGRPEGGAARPGASPPPLTGQGSPNPPPEAAAAGGRDAQGRFAAGNKGG